MVEAAAAIRMAMDKIETYVDWPLQLGLHLWDIHVAKSEKLRGKY